MKFTSTQTPQAQRALLNMEPQNQPSRFVLIEAAQLQRLYDTAENVIGHADQCADHCRDEAQAPDIQADGRELAAMTWTLHGAILAAPDVVRVEELEQIEA